MTKTELLLSMPDAFSPIPIGDDWVPGAPDPDILFLLDAGEYQVWTTPGGTPIGFILTEAGRAAWLAARS